MQTRYAVFGSVQQGQKTLEPIIKKEVVEDDYPIAEMTNGVISVNITSHGDDPGSAYVEVWGVSKRRCIKVWRSAAATARLEANNWWGRTG